MSLFHHSFKHPWCTSQYTHMCGCNNITTNNYNNYNNKLSCHWYFDDFPSDGDHLMV